MDSLLEKLYELPGRIIKLHENEYLYSEGEEAKYFYIVQSGQIFVTKTSGNGRTLSLRLARKGSILGELALFGAEGGYIFNGIAQSPAEVYAIEIPLLERQIEKDPDLGVALLKIYSKHMRKQHSKFRDLLLYGKKGALYSTLIRLANSYGRQEEGGILISVPLTNQELANYSATARESTNRMLTELRKLNIIEYRNHLICIKNLQFLKNEIQCEECSKEICNIE